MPVMTLRPQAWESVAAPRLVVSEMSRLRKLSSLRIRRAAGTEGAAGLDCWNDCKSSRVRSSSARMSGVDAAISLTYD